MIDIKVQAQVQSFRLDVETSIPTPGIIGIVGPNGSGKSTLLRAMAGVSDAKGSILYNGTPLSSMSRAERVQTVAYVAQSHGTLPDLTVQQLVEMGQSAAYGLFGRGSGGDEAIVEEALIHSDLVGLKDRSLRALSGGQVQRAMTARALAQNAKFLLLDEPTNHLDLHHQYRLMNMLDHVGRNHGTTVVLALHDLVLAARFCDTVLVMEHGHVAGLGDPSETLTPELLRETFGVDAWLRKADGEHSLIVHGPVINR